MSNLFSEMHKVLLCTIGALLLLFQHEAASQSSWTRAINQPDTNFYAIQKKFENYWEGKEVTRGSGWKPFKRWAYFMKPRVYPDGQLPAPQQAWRAYKKYKKHQPAQRGRSFNGNWQPLGPEDWNNGSSGYNPGNGRINAIAVDPKDSTRIFIGTPSGGLWRSTDAGATWSPLTDTLPVIGVSSIAIHPTHPDTLYIATGDGDGGDTYSIGILKSTNGGNSWQTTGLSWNVTQYAQINDLLILPDRPNILLAGTDNSIYRSTDGGANWSNVASGYFRDLALMPGNTSVVYAAGDEFFRSTNSGQSFTQVPSGLPNNFNVNRYAIGVTPAAAHFVYLLAVDDSDNGFYGLYRSTDTGQTFVQQSSTPNILGYASDGSSSGGQGWYDLAIAVSPTNSNTLYTGGINIWKSTDGGQTWNISSHWYYPNNYPYVHADIHTLEIFNGILFAGSDGGIFKTTDGGNNWTDLSQDLNITQFYRMGDYPGDAGMLCGGSQDNGSNVRKNGNWTHVFGADGMECIINYNDPNTIYVSSQSGGLRKSTNGGGSFSGITSGISESGAWVTPYVMHPTNPSTLFAGFENVWVTYDGGGSWTQLSNFFSGQLHSLKLAPSDPNTIYTATYYDIYRSTDGGSNWVNINGSLPFSSAALTRIAVHSKDPNKIWVTFSGYTSNEKVYKSTNGGNTWTNYSGTLPNLPVNCIAFTKDADEGVYIGTDVGIFYRDSTMSDWVPFMDSLPNVIIDELDIHYNSNKVRAATHGRGIWESDLYTCGNTNKKPEPSISANDTVICQGASVNFQGSANHCPVAWKWQFPGGTANDSTSPTPTVNYTDTGTHTVHLTVTNNGGDSTLTRTDYIEVKPAPPQPKIFIQDSLLYITQSPDSVQWYWYGSPIIGATDTTHKYDRTGNYTVKIFNDIGCPNTSKKLFVTGLTTAQQGKKLRIYPNPNSGHFTMQLNFRAPLETTLAIKDVVGHTVWQQQLEKPAGPYKTTFQLDELPGGVYFLFLYTDRSPIVQKLVVR